MENLKKIIENLKNFNKNEKKIKKKNFIKSLEKIGKKNILVSYELKKLKGEIKINTEKIRIENELKKESERVKFPDLTFYFNLQKENTGHLTPEQKENIEQNGLLYKKIRGPKYGGHKQKMTIRLKPSFKPIKV